MNKRSRIMGQNRGVVLNRKNHKKRNYIRAALLGLGVLMVAACWQNLDRSGDTPAMQEILQYARSNLYMKALKIHMPTVAAASEEGEEEEEPGLFRDYLLGKIMAFLPIQKYMLLMQDYDTEVESELTYEMLAAREGVDEQYVDGELVGAAETESAASGNADGQARETVNTGTGSSGTATEPVVQISLEKLNDFDYLIQNFYTVDRTTTIDSSQLSARELLAKDMKLTTTSDKPQILIHHTHSQEGYTDSTGDASTSIVGVGEYLTKLLREKYGFNVIHDTGEYDVIDHDNAYSYAGPAVEKILAENPSVEVIIDMHRDGVKEGTHLVTELNGKKTAQIMFFNGLSRTTANGNLEYLANPNLSDNLAFSLQLRMVAEGYYPGFTRTNYLKGYRYNLHYRPKSILVEVGAQTNTVQEAMNAMEPLADMLHKVLFHPDY